MFAGAVFPSGSLKPPSSGNDWSQNTLSAVKSVDGLVEFVHDTSGGFLALSDTESQVTLVGHARLDEVGQLCDHFGIAQARDQIAERCIIAAYQKYGTEMCQYLGGEFAFALWDSKKHRLIMARDRFGVRQIFFRLQDNALRFASDPKLLADGARPRISRTACVEFLVGLSSGPDTVLYPGVSAVSAAHCVIWSKGSLHSQRYWKLELKDGVSSEPAEEFRALFEQAVTRRLGTTNDTSAMLSGGLDSSAICVVAAAHYRDAQDLGLQTYSTVYRKNSEIDESGYIDAVISNAHIRSTKLQLDGHDPLEGVAEAQVGLGKLINAPGLLKNRKVYRAAAADHAKIILDGHGGDEVVSHGGEHLIDLARQGQWLKILPLLSTYSMIRKIPLMEAARSLSVYGPQDLKSRVLRRALRLPNRSAKSLAPQLSDFVAQRTLEETGALDRLNIRISYAKEKDDFARAFHRDLAGSPNVSEAFYAMDWASRVEGIEARYPFFDRELVEFCISAPGSEKIRRGETRSLMRRGLRDSYPKKVLKRQTKVEFRSEIAEGLQRHHSHRLDQLRAGIPQLAGIANQPVLTSAVENVLRLGRNAEAQDAIMTWRMACLAILVTDNADQFDLSI